jgi:hypothetical protein
MYSGEGWEIECTAYIHWVIAEMQWGIEDIQFVGGNLGTTERARGAAAQVDRGEIQARKRMVGVQAMMGPNATWARPG